MSGQTIDPSTDAQAELRDLHSLIKAARVQRQAGGGPVLDILSRSAADRIAEIREQLEKRAGVVVVERVDGLTPEYSDWSREEARATGCVVVLADQGQWLAAAEDPWDEALVLRASRKVGRHLTPAAVSRSVLAAWLGGSDPPASARALQTRIDSERADGPIVQFVDQAIAAAVASGASDVHFECDRAGVAAKHRLDGVMVAYARLEGPQAAQEVISRIKVLAQLDITERRVPQDGRFRWAAGKNSVDMRVSIMPSVHGEDAVLRLLDKGQLRSRALDISLESLGFTAAHAAMIRDIAHSPSGMLLVTGPTGSGKTTTVYAALSEINNGLEKIVTIEDPVEYELTGVLQIPVNDRKGLSFAKGLRSILRHDPDRILVGEIRDAETAEIAVQSALTGHMVFTTVHANSVADIIGRFRHFGLDMFGFMSALNAILVQRLLRRLCPCCAECQPTMASEQQSLARWGRPAVARVPKAIGCAQCRGTGYKGRFVLAEVHTIDDVLRDLVTNGASLSALKAHAAASGVQSLATQAAEAICGGRTTLEEVKRVVGPL